VHVIIMSWRSAWERIVVKRATPLVVLTVAAAIGLADCSQRTESATTAPPPPAPPAPAYAPPPPPEPYVAPAPRRVVHHRVRHVRHYRKGRLHRKVTTSTTTTMPAPSR
jgi:hypothetical protein